MNTLVLAATTALWGVLCGAVVYEHLAVIPQWTKRPPDSLTMWRGEYRLRAERFWMAIHPVLIVLVVASLVANWSDTDQRTMLLVVAAGYAVVIATTGAWYVPELMALTRDPDAGIPHDQWARRSRRWALWCIPRSVLVLGLTIPLLRALVLA